MTSLLLLLKFLISLFILSSIADKLNKVEKLWIFLTFGSSGSWRSSSSSSSWRYGRGMGVVEEWGTLDGDAPRETDDVGVLACKRKKGFERVWSGRVKVEDARRRRKWSMVDEAQRHASSLYKCRRYLVSSTRYHHYHRICLCFFFFSFLFFFY